jgi:hypothetical protein
MAPPNLKAQQRPKQIIIKTDKSREIRWIKFENSGKEGWW